jgi:alkylhydroperoxidase family enzyme
MHKREARKPGESEERLFVLDAWRESPLYTDRERTVHAWTEAVTRVAQSQASEDIYDLARGLFSEAELVELTVAVVTINAWNRIAIRFRGVHPTGRVQAA